MIKTKAIRFIQNNRVFYSVVLPASQLIKISKVDVWDPDNPDNGYQRAPSNARKHKIGQYAMTEDAIMPLGGLLNARSGDGETPMYGKMLKFVEDSSDGNVSFGTLTIPDEIQPLYIVDMQHRLGGYEWAIEQEEGEKLAEFPLVVTISDGLPKMEEVDQFDIINTTQKKVRTDLARRLKSLNIQDVDRRLAYDKMGKLWEAKGPIITQILNNDPGPWQGRILPPNKTKRDQPTMVTRETSFVTSLKPILQAPFFLVQPEEQAAILINRYWEAIKMVWPKCFENPDNYVLQKSAGIFSLHELAPEVFEISRSENGISVNDIYNTVKSLKDIGEEEYWENDNYDGAASYGSMKGFRFLAADLRQFLPKMSLEI